MWCDTLFLILFLFRLSLSQFCIVCLCDEKINVGYVYALHIVFTFKNYICHLSK